MIFTDQEKIEINQRALKFSVNGLFIKEYENITPINYWHNQTIFKEIWELKKGIDYMCCGITEEKPYQYFIDFDNKYKIANPQLKGCTPCINGNCGGWYNPTSLDNSNGECWVCTETRWGIGEL